MTVGQQLHRRAAPVGLGEYPQLLLAGRGAVFADRRLCGMQVRGGGFRYALLKQQGAGLELRVGLEALLHGAIKQQ
ncbi:hypothetical protein D3C79_1003100 [compost metagenome]